MAEKDELQKLIEQVKSLQEEVKKAKTVGAQREELDKMNVALEKANQYYKDNKSTIESTAPELEDQLRKLGEKDHWWQV